MAYKIAEFSYHQRDYEIEKRAIQAARVGAGNKHPAFKKQEDFNLEIYKYPPDYRKYKLKSMREKFGENFSDSTEEFAEETEELLDLHDIEWERE